MINNILKVYDEDLARGDLASGAISGTKPVCVGTTGGALCVNVFAEGDVNIVDVVILPLNEVSDNQILFATVGKRITCSSDQLFGLL